MTLLQWLHTWREQRQAERDATELVKEILAKEPEWREQLEEMRDAPSDV